MKKLTARFGKLITASFIIMAFGLILFLLTPLLYGKWGIDTDIPGMMIVFIGLAICIFGIIRRNKLQGWKRAVLTILAIILLLPLVQLIISLIYYGITGKPLGG